MITEEERQQIEDMKLFKKENLQKIVSFKVGKEYSVCSKSKNRTVEDSGKDFSIRGLIGNTLKLHFKSIRISHQGYILIKERD